MWFSSYFCINTWVQAQAMTRCMRYSSSLKRIEDYRIRELIIENLKIYKCASLNDIHERIGKEIPAKKIWAQLYNLIGKGYVRKIGENRWTKYLIVEDSSLFQNRE